jgi:hypothetical protein
MREKEEEFNFDAEPDSSLEEEQVGPVEFVEQVEYVQYVKEHEQVERGKEVFYESEEGSEYSDSDGDDNQNYYKLQPLQLFERPLICGELATHNFHCSRRERDSKKQKLEQRTTSGGKSSLREKVGGVRPNIP